MPRLRSLLGRVAQDAGVSALEVILLASGFLVVASAFGGVVLTTGLTSSGQVQRTLNDALARSGSGLELRGPVIVVTDGDVASVVSIDVALSIGSEGVNLDPAAPLDRTVVSFIDGENAIRELPYTTQWTVGDDDQVLESGELAAVLVDVSTVVPAVTSGSQFQIEVRPPHGSYLIIRRTLPSGSPMDTIVNLN